MWCRRSLLRRSAERVSTARNYRGCAGTSYFMRRFRDTRDSGPERGRTAPCLLAASKPMNEVPGEMRRIIRGSSSGRRCSDWVANTRNDPRLELCCGLAAKWACSLAVCAPWAATARRRQPVTTRPIPCILVMNADAGVQARCTGWVSAAEHFGLAKLELRARSSRRDHATVDRHTDRSSTSDEIFVWLSGHRGAAWCSD